MANLNKSKDPPLFLFPIFNILVCTLGTFLVIGGIISSFSFEISGLITNVEISEIEQEHGYSPEYVIWDGNGFISINRNDTAYITFKEDDFENEIKFKRKIDLQLKNTFAEYLFTKIKQNQNKYLVILVRPSGFKKFLYMREYLIDSRIKIGYEAVGQYWVLNTN